MSTIHKILITLIVLLIGAIIFTGLHLFKQTTTTGQSSDLQTLNDGSLNSLYSSEEKEGNSFAAAEEMLRQGPDGYSAARAFYEAALAEATSIEQKAHIDYKIGLTYTNIDGNSTAIEHMKRIALTEEYPGQQRAYAVQYLFLLYAIKAHDPAVIEKIFSGDTFEDLWNEESLDITMRSFSQFGLEFGYVPHLSLVEAQTYAKELFLLDKEADAEEFESYVNRVEAAIPLAYDHMDFISGGANSDQIPKILSRAVIVTGYLNAAGVPGYDQKFVAALDRFYSLEDYYEVSGWQPDFLDQGSAYNFAYLAAHAENEQAFTIVKSYLDTVIQNPVQYSGVRKTVTSQKDGAFSGKERPSYLAAYYEPFKQYLLENGWSETDLLNVDLSSTYESPVTSQQ